MNGFDPGPGWVRGEDPEIVAAESGLEEVLHLVPGKRVERFVRRARVRPLPTAAYTVIRVTWSPNYGRQKPTSILVKQDEHGWYGDGYAGTPEVLSKDIVSFEVLSQPRAVTAKAILDRVRLDGHDHRPILNQIAQEFDVKP